MGQPDPAPLCRHLARQLADHYPCWRVTALEPVGAGLSFLVCRAHTAALGPVAVRVPWRPVFADDNDGEVAARPLLQQEAVIARHLDALGLPVPAIHTLHLGADGFDFLVSDFIEQDASPPDAIAFGQLMRQLHAVPPPILAPVGQGALPISQVIAARLTRRAAAIARLTNVRLPLPPEADLIDLLATRDRHRALLHMDARPANLFTRQGQIVAIADWGNALIGDPALELARITEFGHLSAGFLAGYGAEPSLTRLPPSVATLYRLDTAVMLALVFLAEAPDPTLAAHYMTRATTLAATL